MQDKQTLVLFMEIFIIIIVLGVLAALVIPHVIQMINEGKIASQDAESYTFPAPAAEMLYNSGAVAPVNRADSPALTVLPLTA
jgi:Tfp pilus assembly protein PilE